MVPFRFSTSTFLVLALGYLVKFVAGQEARVVETVAARRSVPGIEVHESQLFPYKASISSTSTKAPFVQEPFVAELKGSASAAPISLKTSWRPKGAVARMLNPAVKLEISTPIKPNSRPQFGGEAGEVPLSYEKVYAVTEGLHGFNTRLEGHGYQIGATCRTNRNTGHENQDNYIVLVVHTNTTEVIESGRGDGGMFGPPPNEKAMENPPLEETKSELLVPTFVVHAVYDGHGVYGGVVADAAVSETKRAALAVLVDDVPLPEPGSEASPGMALFGGGGGESREAVVKKKVEQLMSLVASGVKDEIARRIPTIGGQDQLAALMSSGSTMSLVVHDIQANMLYTVGAGDSPVIGGFRQADGSVKVRRMLPDHSMTCRAERERVRRDLIRMGLRPMRKLSHHDGSVHVIYSNSVGEYVSVSIQPYGSAIGKEVYLKFDFRVGQTQPGRGVGFHMDIINTKEVSHKVMEPPPSATVYNLTETPLDFLIVASDGLDTPLADAMGLKAKHISETRKQWLIQRNRTVEPELFDLFEIWSADSRDFSPEFDDAHDRWLTKIDGMVDEEIARIVRENRDSGPYAVVNSLYEASIERNSKKPLMQAYFDDVTIVVMLNTTPPVKAERDTKDEELPKIPIPKPIASNFVRRDSAPKKGFAGFQQWLRSLVFGEPTTPTPTSSSTTTTTTTTTTPGDSISSSPTSTPPPPRRSPSELLAKEA